MSEDRLIDIETKIAFQEDLLQELNKIVCQQQKQLDQLTATCESLARHILDLRESVAERNAGNEKPPHY